MKYEYYLFDWDGTLAKTLDIWLAALKAPLEKRGHSFKDPEIGANFTAFSEKMKTRGVKNVDAIVDEADKIASREAPNVTLYDDAKKTLETLHASGSKIALVTTSRHNFIDPLLEKYGLESIFEVVVCGDDVVHQKPDPEPIEKALELLGAPKVSSVMVGDSESDIFGARNAGIDSILFSPASHSKFYAHEHSEILQPTYTVASLSDILDITA